MGSWETRQQQGDEIFVLRKFCEGERRRGSLHAKLVNIMAAQIGEREDSLSSGAPLPATDGGRTRLVWRGVESNWFSCFPLYCFFSDR